MRKVFIALFVALEIAVILLMVASILFPSEGVVWPQTNYSI